MSWLTRCWRTHGAAKVVRLHGLELHAQAAPPGLRVLLLLRQPAEVCGDMGRHREMQGDIAAVSASARRAVASRLSLEA